jgi:hypothetical protein
MTHPDIDIETLWQSQAPVVDSDAVLNHIRSEMRAQRLLDIAYAAVIGLSLVLTGYFELAGAYRFPWLLFGAVAASGVAFTWWRIRQRTRLPETASLAPKAMLRFALRQARTTYQVAQGLYTVLPLGLAAGYVAGPLFSSVDNEFVRPLWLKLLMFVATAALFTIVIVAGVRMARAARQRLTTLEQRLVDFDDYV